MKNVRSLILEIWQPVTLGEDPNSPRLLSEVHPCRDYNRAVIDHGRKTIQSAERAPSPRFQHVREAETNDKISGGATS